MTSERPLPHVALSAHAHNRMGLRRTDEVWLSERMSDPATRVLVVAGNRLRPVDGEIAWAGGHCVVDEWLELSRKPAAE